MSPGKRPDPPDEGSDEVQDRGLARLIYGVIAFHLIPLIVVIGFAVMVAGR